MNPTFVRVAVAVLATPVIVSLVAGNWQLALLHVNTLLVVLLIDDSVRVRRRLRELEDALRELIET